MRTTSLSLSALALAGCLQMDQAETETDPTLATEESNLQLPVDLMQFKQVSTGLTLAGQAVWDDMSYAYGQADLKTLPSTSIYDVLMRYSSPTDRTEMAVFGADPEIVHRMTMIYMGLHGADSAGLGYLRSEPGRLGTEALYPYPNDDMIFAPYTLETQIPPHAAFGTAGWTSPAVRAARIYDAGLCMNEIPYSGKLAEIKTDFTDSLNTIIANVKEQAGVAGGLIDYIAMDGRVAAYLDHTDAVNTDQKGGFVAAFFAHAAIDVLPDEYINFVYEVPLVLDQGMVKAKKNRIYGTTDGPQIGSMQSNIFNMVETQVQAQIDNLNKEILRSQAPPVAACDPTAPDFSTAMTLFGAAVGLGAAHNNVSLADQTTIQNVVHDPAQWICMGNNPKDPHSGDARFLARAARLNYYPNALGVVLFDAPDPTSNGYIAWLAVQGIPDPTQRAAATKKLCTFSHKSGFAWPNLFYTRANEAIDLF